MKRLITFLLVVMFSISVWCQSEKIVVRNADGTTEQLSYDKQQKLDGRCLMWNADSVKIAEANYLHGVKHGEWKIYYDNGQLAYQMFYSQGEKVGTWKHWDAEGKFVTQKHYR
jgi:antitoxin component YwqK of YwqJK toxin-antitoxin module